MTNRINYNIMKRKGRFQNPWGKDGEYYNQSAVGGSTNVEPPTSLVSETGEGFYPGQTSTETPSGATDSINTGRLLQYEDEETEEYNPWAEDGEYYPDNVLDSKDPNDPKSVLYTTAVARQNQTNIEEGGFYYSKDGGFLGEIKGKKQAVRVVTQEYIDWKGDISKTIDNIAQIQKGINSGNVPSKKNLENLNTKYSEVVYGDNKELLDRATWVFGESGGSDDFITNRTQNIGKSSSVLDAKVVDYYAHAINNAAKTDGGFYKTIKMRMSKKVNGEIINTSDGYFEGTGRGGNINSKRFANARVRGLFDLMKIPNTNNAIAAVISSVSGGIDPTGGTRAWLGSSDAKKYVLDKDIHIDKAIFQFSFSSGGGVFHHTFYRK
jgi:hypothetical protein